MRQCLATGGLTKRYRPPAQGLAPKVHGRRCGAPGRYRRPLRHALGTRHQHLLQRALLVFGDTRTARLASISVAHSTTWRGAAGHRARRQQGTKTRPTGIDRGAPWEIVATWRAALCGYLLPVIKAMLEGFPFMISGFHADNGSECTVVRKCFGDSHPRSVMQCKSTPSAPHTSIPPSTDSACSPRTPSIPGKVKEKRYSAKLSVGGMSESAYPCA